jgi:hypothetical protein
MIPAMVFALATCIQANPLTPGLKVGESVSSFEPYWVSGPYAGTTQCPVCEYGLLPMVIVWSHLKDPKSLQPILKVVNDAVSEDATNKRKAILVDVNAESSDQRSQKSLKGFSDDWKFPKVYFMSRVGSKKASLEDFKLTPISKWETIVYVVKDRSVTAKFVDPKVDDAEAISDAIRATSGR